VDQVELGGQLPNKNTIHLLRPEPVSFGKGMAKEHRISGL
jgi:hypothetical protein